MILKHILSLNDSFVKKLITEDFLKIKVFSSNISVFVLFFKYNNSVKLIQDLLNYVKNNCFDLLSKENYHNIFYYISRRKNLKIVKYTLNFIKNNNPKMFFLKNRIGEFDFINNISDCRTLKVKKYYLNFTKNNFPDLFLEKDDYGGFITYYDYDNKNECTCEFSFNFIKNNFPEILSDNYFIDHDDVFPKNNHIILPLTFQIQN